MSATRKLIWILTDLLLVCLTTLGVLYGIAFRHRIQAQTFLAEFAQLKLGDSTFEEAQRLAREYNGIPWYVASDDMQCTYQKCSLAFKFENMPLGYVPFVYHTELFAEIQVVEGIVTGRQLVYERNRGSNYCFMYLVFDTANQSVAKAWTPGSWRHVDPKGVQRQLGVRLGPPSADAERQKAYALDLSCLAKVYGCGKASSFYPPGVP